MCYFLLEALSKKEGASEIVIAYVLIYAGGKEEEAIKKVRKFDQVKEAHLVYFGQGETAIIAQLITPNMTQKELEGFIRKKIRHIDFVTSTGTMIVVSPEKKYKPIDEDLIEEEKDNWGPWNI